MQEVKPRKLCKKFQGKNGAEETLSSSIHTHIYTKISLISEDWDSLNTADDMLFSSQYLEIIEKNPPQGITPYYLLTFEDAQPIGAFYFQYKYVRLEDNLRDIDGAVDKAEKSLTQFIKAQCIKSINFPTLVCGNLMITGAYGFRFVKGVNTDNQKKYLSSAIDHMITRLKSENIYPGLVIVKDFEDASRKDDFKLDDFTNFYVQPNMRMQIKPEWTTFSEYLFDLKSKYRVRYKKAQQTTAGLVKKELTKNEIIQYRENIYKLYKNISDQAKFNSFVLDMNYFETLKNTLGKKLQFISYWKDDILVGFYTTIKHDSTLEAHFLGYDIELNKICHLYLAMLYDMVETAITLKCETLNMSRTAIEIKSTVGAQPQDMYVQLRHTHKLLNKTVGRVVEWVNPTQEYIIRSPFKE